MKAKKFGWQDTRHLSTISLSLLGLLIDVRNKYFSGTALAKTAICADQWQLAFHLFLLLYNDNGGHSSRF